MRKKKNKQNSYDKMGQWSKVEVEKNSSMQHKPSLQIKKGKETTTMMASKLASKKTNQNQKKER